MSEITTAVILCGGQGTRLRPITYEIPKPLIPVHGKAVVEHIFDLLKRHGITEVVLSVGYLKERIRDHFGDGSRCGMRISYLEEREPLGTAGPIRLLKEQGLLPSGPFVVSNGDELKDIDIDAMLAVHKRVGALATDALTPVSDPSLYGIARLEG
ncbi:MAG TPA: nucleotidyltransferase family protein, partial [archaeon]|nr:nucleotidyltransferase family protein [archaeon]